VKWYRLAADHGDADAQFNLALSYDKGEGVPKDYVLAHLWFNLAAVKYGSDKAKRDIAVAGRDRVAKLMTASQIAEAQKLAREWKLTK
jgi:TPR repeat protein